MSTEKEFHYYQLSEEDSKRFLNEFREKAKKRKSIILTLIAELEVVAWSEGDVYTLQPPNYSAGFYFGQGLSHLYWNSDHDFGDYPVIKKPRDHQYISVRGNCRYKTGKEFNKRVHELKIKSVRELKEFPDFRFFMNGKVGLEGKGETFTSSYMLFAGWSSTNGVIYGQIPKGCDYQPAKFLTPITYGQYYDMNQRCEE